MDTIGLLDRITNAVIAIAEGRRGLEIEGSTETGRVSYRDGLAEAMAVFQEVTASGDARTSILVDHAYVTQERQFCDPQDVDAIGSLTAAVTGFDDALRVLPTVADAAAYHFVETSYPHDSTYRVGGMPKDAADLRSVHIACIGHKMRLLNTLRTPGLSMMEKAVYQQRRENMSAVQSVYLALQQTAMR
ncbi:hypothetical protein AGMMS4952_26850 [Spirochaetia bacterium]|nr:hypothetical protein AGMMS4952_26850 [Spirochaetia bacterium]